MTAEPARPWDAQRCAEIIASRRHLEGPLLPILQAVLRHFGHVPPEAVAIIAEALNLSRAEVHGVVSFYHDFRTTPAGRRVLRICRAEACQAMGGRQLAEDVLRGLGLDWGETTADGEVTVEPVYCLGLCAVGPSAMLDGRPIGRAVAADLLAEVAR